MGPSAGHRDALPTEGTAWVITYCRKVRYSDTDAQGIVFNANYLTYFDDTLNDLLDLAGLTEESMLGDGYGVVTARAEVDFKSSARLGDVLVTAARVKHIGGASITFELETRVESDGRVAAKGSVVFVSVDPATKRPVMVPDVLAGALQAIHTAPIAIG